MAGLAFLLALSSWAMVLAGLIGYASRNFRLSKAKRLVQAMLLILLIPMPLVDEIIGSWQFDNLCAASRVIFADKEHLKGKVVRLRQVEAISSKTKSIPKRFLTGTAVPVREDIWEYLDVGTGESLVMFKTYTAFGGFLVRRLSQSEGSSPVTFRGYCEPPDAFSELQALGVKKLDERN